MHGRPACNKIDSPPVLRVCCPIMSRFTIPDAADCFILAGDIGGTNTTIALMETVGGELIQRHKRSFASREISGLDQAIDASLPEFAALLGGKPIRGACFTAAGPVEGNTCQLTNVKWRIDANAIGARLGYPAYVVNDLSGICYGIPLLDPADPLQITPMPHPDGGVPAPQDLRPGMNVRAVVAPGTGLGIGYLIHESGNYIALPAEAGHIDYGAYSDETRALQNWVHRRLGKNPGTEQFISGIGLENVFQFMVDESELPRSPAVDEVLAAAKGMRGALISKHAGADPLCAHVMELFVEMMGRFMSSVALWSLPKAGLYIAGGIPAKNKEWFLKDHRFMKAFLANYLPGMESQLRQIPVYMAMDYGINLYGAAHGFHCLDRSR